MFAYPSFRPSESHPGGRQRRPVALHTLLLVLGLAGLLLAWPAPAAGAHPAPSVIHDYLVVLGDHSGTVYLRFAVSAPLVPQVYRQIDTNGDGVTQPAERQAWLARYLANMHFSIDGRAVPIAAASASAIDQHNLVVSMQHAVTVTMQLNFTLPPDPATGPPADHHFILSDNTNYVGYDEYYSSWEDAPGAVTTAHDLTQPANPAMFEAVFERDPTTLTPGPAAGGAPPAGAIPPPQEGAGSDFLSQLDAFLHNPNGSTTFGLTLFVLAVVLGGLHALTPGHGKTIVAAYLVGSRGRVRDAVALGTIVTLTHTLSVVALGLVLLALTNFILPRWFQPALELASGLLVVVLGLYLLTTRVRALGSGGAGARAVVAGAGGDPAHRHSHEAAPEHAHPHPGANGPGPGGVPAAVPTPQYAAALAGRGQAGAFAAALPALTSPAHTHSHDDHTHTHAHSGEDGADHVHPDAADSAHVHAEDAGADPVHTHFGAARPHTHVPPADVRPRDLLALGVSGGLVPCPDALAILFLTLPIGQLGLGILLVCSFSIGLAAVLIALGVLMVTARALLDRIWPTRAGGSPAWVRYSSVASAVIVTVVGVLLMLGAVFNAKF